MNTLTRMLTKNSNKLVCLTLLFTSHFVLSGQSKTDDFINIVKENLQTVSTDHRYKTNNNLKNLATKQLRRDAHRIQVRLKNETIGDESKEKLLTLQAQIKSTFEETLQEDLEISELVVDEFFQNDFITSEASIEDAPENILFGGYSNPRQGQIRGSYTFTSSGHSVPFTHINLYNNLGERVRRQYQPIGASTFSINDLPAGDYYLVIIAWGYQDLAYPNIPCHRGIGIGCSIEDLQPISLNTNDSLSGFDFILEPQRSTFGQFSTSDDDPHSYLFVEGYDATDNYLGTYGELNGQFNFELEQPGDYKFVFYSDISRHNEQMFQNIICSGRCDLSLARMVNVVDMPVDLGQIILHPNRNINGRLIDDDTNLPVTDIKSIDFIGADSGWIFKRLYTRNISADGSWSVSLQARNYHIRVQTATHAVHYAFDQNCPDASLESCDLVNINPTVIEHNAVQDIDQMELRLIRGGFISGKVNQPQVTPGSYEGDVNLYDATGNLLTSTEIQPDGSYAFTGLDNGNYHVSARANLSLTYAYPDFYCDIDPDEIDRCLDVTGSTPITLVDYSQLTDIDIQLVAAPEVHGTVVDQHGIPLRGFHVRAINQNENSELTSRAFDVTNDLGQFKLSGLYYGSFYLQANHPYNDSWNTMVYQDVWCQDDDYQTCNTAGATELALSQSIVYDGYQLVMVEKSKIEVAVQAGTADFDGYLFVYDTTGELLERQNVNNSRVSTIQVPPGDYYLMYQDSGHDYDPLAQYVSTIYGGDNCYESCDPLTGSLIQVPPQSTVAINLAVDSSHQINISFVDKPNGVDVELYMGGNRLGEEYLYGNPSTAYINVANDVLLALESDGYYLHFFNGVQCPDVACGLGSGTALQPVVNGVTQFNAHMQPLTHISGHVRDSSGEPIRANISLYQVGQSQLYSSTGSDEQNNGYFEINGLPEGDYYLYVYGSYHPYTNTLYWDEHCTSFDCCNKAQAQIINVRKDQFIQNLNLNLQKTGSLSIENTRYPDNIPVKDAVFWLYQWNGNHYEYVVEQRLTNYHVDTTHRLYQEDYKLMAVQELDGMYIKSVYPNIPCIGIDTQSCLSMGEDVSVNFGANTLIDDFIISQPPAIDIHVVDQQTGEYVSQYEIRLIRPNGRVYVVESVTETVNGLRIPLSYESSFILEISTSITSPYKGQLYNGIECDQGLGVDCELEQGTTVTLDGNELRVIDISLQKRPELTVRVLDDITRQPVETNIVIYDINENEFKVAENVIGEHIFNLKEGQYYVLADPTHHAYRTEAFDNVRCLSPPIGACPDTIQLINVSDSTTPEINILIDQEHGIGGYVIDATNGLPLSGVDIDFWHHDQLITSLETAPNGGFSYPGREFHSYQISTHVPDHLGYIDEVYDDIKCLNGPAIDGLCDHRQGQSVHTFRSENILVELQPDQIYFNGFDGEN